MGCVLSESVSKYFAILGQWCLEISLKRAYGSRQHASDGRDQQFTPQIYALLLGVWQRGGPRGNHRTRTFAFVMTDARVSVLVQRQPLMTEKLICHSHSTALNAAKRSALAVKNIQFLA